MDRLRKRFMKLDKVRSAPEGDDMSEEKEAWLTLWDRITLAPSSAKSF